MSAPLTPRVLLVTFNRLVPADQGNSRRIMQLVGLYKRQGFEVDLIYHQEEGSDPGLTLALAQQFGRVMVVPSRSSKVIGPGHVARIRDWYDRGLTSAALQMHTLRGYQVLHVNYCWYTPLFEHFGAGVTKVLDTHDVFANRAQKYIKAGMAPQWFSTTEADEDKALRLADAALAIQREEGAELAARGHGNVLYLPYVEPALTPFEVPPAGRPLTLGYLGSGNDWNILSMQRFLQALDKRRQQSHFPHPVVVAGGICKHLRDHTGVTRLGFVKELHTFYRAVDIAVNPMVGGTGLKIKTVEPLSYGTPVVCTPSGAQGLEHLWTQPVVADPQEMVDWLYERFVTAAPERQRDHLAELVAQARSSRAALDTEYDAQVAKFAHWLRERLR